jgi:transposase-like protein
MPQAWVVRARIVLAAGSGISNQEIAAQLGITAATVGKWRSKYWLFGIDGLKDWKRAGRPAKYGLRAQHSTRHAADGVRQTPPEAGHTPNVQTVVVHLSCVVKRMRPTLQNSHTVALPPFCMGSATGFRCPPGKLPVIRLY